MLNISISVINASKVLTNDDVQRAVPALQTQVSRDFAPAWGIDANLKFVPATAVADPATWWLAILDDSDQAGALGYHDVTSAGLPLGKVFAKTDLQYNLQWTVTASHELLEMLGDPEINLTVFVQNDQVSGRLYAYEVCDACEDDRYGYDIQGTLVSDFVYPAWFESFQTAGSAQFDYGKQINAPFALLPGGYIGIFDVFSGSGWQQLTAANAPREFRHRAPVGSRRERRKLNRQEWMKSQLRKATKA